jgi:ribonuclease P protein component
MHFKSASLLTKYSKLEIEKLFKTISLKFRRVGLEILLAPRSLNYGRLLLSVSRRTGNSPQRNLFKRRMRAVFYENQLFNLNFDWVIIVKTKSALKHDFAILQKTILAIAHEINH